MRILSNAFPTNMPDSEKVSQGGPANFARLFVHYLFSTEPHHEWVGVMLESVSEEQVSMRKVFSSGKNRYHQICVPREQLKNVVRAKKASDTAEAILKQPISRLVAFMKKQRPDVVFLNGFGLLNWMLLKAAEELHIPVVVQHAGIWTKELDIHKKLYTVHGLRLMKNMELDSTRLTAMEVFLNTWSREYYQKNIAKGAGRKNTIIPLPFDFSSFNQLGVAAETNAFAFDPAYRHVGVIARWDEIKNHPAVLALAKKAKKKRLPVQFHAVVDIPDIKKYRSETAEYGKYVHVIPPLDRPGIAAFCRSVDLLLLPSLFDVSPTVVLEAVASDVPIVISTNIGYVHDFSSCGAKSWIVRPEKTEETLETLLKLSKRKMPVTLGQLLQKKHDHRKVFSAYLRVFEKVVNRP
jgi:glycosyltransferase involved in cell wall biosynthesis